MGINLSGLRQKTTQFRPVYKILSNNAILVTVESGYLTIAPYQPEHDFSQKTLIMFKHKKVVKTFRGSHPSSGFERQ